MSMQKNLVLWTHFVVLSGGGRTKEEQQRTLFLFLVVGNNTVGLRLCCVLTVVLIHELPKASWT
jgi:hypothetical protein